MISPAIAAIAIAVLTAVAFGGGFLVSDWRSNAQIERLKGKNTILSSSNDRCVLDVANVRAAVIAMEGIAREREKQAEEAMKQAEPIVERHTAKIIRIRSLPSVKPDMQCEAIKAEQIAYVQSRRDESQ